MACVDANYRFLMVDIDDFGKQGDAWTFSSSQFGKLLLEDKLAVPETQCLPGSTTECPHVFVGDEAFPSHTDLLRPYPRAQLDEDRHMYYRLSRARRIVKNAFGILSARWRISNVPIKAMPENVDRIVKGTVVLHNYLKCADASSPPNCRDIPPAFAITKIYRVQFILANGEGIYLPIKDLLGMKDRPEILIIIQELLMKFAKDLLDISKLTMVQSLGSNVSS